MFRVILAALLVHALCACSAGGNAGDDGARGPVVLASSSMQEALVEAGEVWAARGHRLPVVSFAASSALARQIDSGAPADLFISADEAWMDHVQDNGRLRAGSRANLASNRLVLVAEPGSQMGQWDGQGASLMAALGNGRLAMADPQAVPAGRYAKASLESLGLWADVAGRIATAENVRAALALVERGQTPLGIVYTTDAGASGLRVLFRFPASSHSPIRYPMALLAASRHRDAEGFRAFLLSPDGQQIMTRHGFGAAS